MGLGDKAGAHSVTERPIVGNGGQETAALRPTDSAESNERQLLLRTVPKEGGRGGGVDSLAGQISCLSIIADVAECAETKGTNDVKAGLIRTAGIWTALGREGSECVHSGMFCHAIRTRFSLCLFVKVVTSCLCFLVPRWKLDRCRPGSRPLRWGRGGRAQ